MPITKEAPKTYKSIDERWDWIVTFMVLEDQFVHEVLMMMEKRSSFAISTMAVGVQDATLTMFYNPKFVEKLSDPELRFVVSHEIYHVALHHVTTRRPEDRKQAGIWNKAFDLAINSLIQDNPERHMPKGDLKGLRPKDFGFDEKLSAEQYIQLLRDKNDDGSDGQGGIYGMPGDGEEGDGKGKGFDEHGLWKESEVMNEIIRNKIEQLANRERVWGNMPGDIKSMILAAQRSQISWRKLLRHFFGLIPTTRQQSTFHKPHRRYGFPYCGTKRVHVDRKLLGIDTSGSVGDEELSQFLAEVNKLAEIQPVDMQMFDHALQGELQPFDKKKVKFDVKGRGGTSFQEIMDLAEKRRYSSLIMFTDGQASAIERPKYVKDVIWVIVGNGKPPVDWGRVVNITIKK